VICLPVYVCTIAVLMCACLSMWALYIYTNDYFPHLIFILLIHVTGNYRYDIYFVGCPSAAVDTEAT
jgi:hypothetical protein